MDLDGITDKGEKSKFIRPKREDRTVNIIYISNVFDYSLLQ